MMFFYFFFFNMFIWENVFRRQHVSSNWHPKWLVFNPWSLLGGSPNAEKFWPWKKPDVWSMAKYWPHTIPYLNSGPVKPLLLSSSSRWTLLRFGRSVFGVLRWDEVSQSPCFDKRVSFFRDVTTIGYYGTWWLWQLSSRVPQISVACHLLDTAGPICARLTSVLGGVPEGGTVQTASNGFGTALASKVCRTSTVVTTCCLRTTSEFCDLLFWLKDLCLRCAPSQGVLWTLPACVTTLSLLRSHAWGYLHPHWTGLEIFRQIVLRVDRIRRLV